MTARFWLFSVASAGAALVSGLGLGLYATTPPRVAYSDYEDTASAAQAHDHAPDSAALNGPAEVRCSGCGPTLAERQMAAMTSGWDGYDDPLVRDHEAQIYETPEELADVSDSPPSPVHQMPANVERFAAGDASVSQPMKLVQASGDSVGEASVSTRP